MVYVHAGVAETKEEAEGLCKTFLLSWDLHKSRFQSFLRFVEETSRSCEYVEGWAEEDGNDYGNGVHAYISFYYCFRSSITAYPVVEEYLKSRNSLSHLLCLTEDQYELVDNGDVCTLYASGGQPICSYTYDSCEISFEGFMPPDKQEGIRLGIKNLLAGLQKIPMPINQVIICNRPWSKPDYFFYDQVEHSYIFWRDMGFFTVGSPYQFKTHYCYSSKQHRWWSPYSNIDEDDGFFEADNNPLSGQDLYFTN